MNFLKIINETISDGIGLRMSIYLSGCTHQCPGCHNKSSWDNNAGYVLDDKVINYIIDTYKSNPLLSGITFTGGDPLYNFTEFYLLVKKIKQQLSCNIWVYTGYTFEEIKNEKFLKYIDVLVDGKFIIKAYKANLLFRGSSNQRIIDVKKSLNTDKLTILIE